MPGTLGKITRSKGRAGEQPKSVYASYKFGIFEDRGRLHVTTHGAGGHLSLTKKDGLIYWVFRMIYEKGIGEPDQ